MSSNLKSKSCGVGVRRAAGSTPERTPVANGRVSILLLGDQTETARPGPRALNPVKRVPRDDLPLQSRRDCVLAEWPSRVVTDDTNYFRPSCQPLSPLRPIPSKFSAGSVTAEDQISSPMLFAPPRPATSMPVSGLTQHGSATAKFHDVRLPPIECGIS